MRELSYCGNASAFNGLRNAYEFAPFSRQFPCFNSTPAVFYRFYFSSVFLIRAVISTEEQIYAYRLLAPWRALAPRWIHQVCVPEKPN